MLDAGYGGEGGDGGGGEGCAAEVVGWEGVGDGWWISYYKYRRV